MISRPQRGESLEEWAREQRYAVFTSVMEQGDTLFTAHHLDDQAETFFLQALRGGGPRGLAAMSGFKPFGVGFHARPLLNYTRQQLEAYAKQHDLQWVEDPSNADINIDRNYLRTEILPLIDKRWPAYRNTLDRLIAHQAETALLLDDIASQDLSRVLDIDNNGLLVDRLQGLSEARIKNLLLYWARQKQLDVPGSKHLYQIIQTALKSAAEACPCINWANTEIRRYKDRLYLQQQLPDHDPATVIEWDTHSRLQLNKETLTSEKTDNEGIDEQLLADGKVTMRFRQGGETIRPYNKSMTKTVKQLLQEKEVLPWYRDRLPLIYIDEKLAAIPGICIDENFVIRNKNRSRQIVWSGLNKSLLR